MGSGETARRCSGLKVGKADEGTVGDETTPLDEICQVGGNFGVDGLMAAYGSLTPGCANEESAVPGGCDSVPDIIPRLHDGLEPDRTDDSSDWRSFSRVLIFSCESWREYTSPHKTRFSRIMMSFWRSSLVNLSISMRPVESFTGDGSLGDSAGDAARFDFGTTTDGFRLMFFRRSL